MWQYKHVMGHTIMNLLYRCEQLSHEGWELVSVMHVHPDHMVAVFEVYTGEVDGCLLAILKRKKSS